MKRNILVFGVIAGVIIAAFMATSMAIMSSSENSFEGSTGAMIMGFTAMAVAFSFIFVGMKNYRDKQNGGVLTFGKGFLLGFMISLVASTIYVLTWAVEYHFFLPDFMDKYSAMQIKQLQQSGMTGTALDESIKSIESAKANYSNPVFFALYTYMEILPVGVIITLISAFILRRKTPRTEANPATA